MNFNDTLYETVLLFSPNQSMTPCNKVLRICFVIYSIGQPCRDWQASSCIDSFLTDFFVSSLKDINRNVAIPGNMQYLVRYTESNYLQPLSLEYLSRFSGISCAHHTREFKKYTGFTPNAYIIQLRLDHAKKLLGSSKTSVSTIAFESGSHDINNFINLFKKTPGLLPVPIKNNCLTADNAITLL